VSVLIDRVTGFADSLCRHHYWSPLMITRIGLVALLSLLAGSPVEMLACGDKFFVPSRGMQYQRRVIDREAATILLYASPGSLLNATFAKLSIAATLRKAGYQPTVMSSATEFQSALRTGRWDVIVVDLADVPPIIQAASVGAAPIVLPVTHDPAKAAFDVAKKEYRHVLKSPKRNQAFLDAVDEVITARAKARAKSVTSTGV
jgi:hypothetical protein